MTDGADVAPRLLQIKQIAKGGYGEVYEMLDQDTDKRFARKSIRPFGGTTEQDVANEAAAITKLCAIGKHRNIVDILRHGQSHDSDYYLIDMELCDLDLHGYIHDQMPAGFNSVTQPSTSLAFVSKDCELQLKLQNVFTILTHIVNGLEFAHKNQLVHRDLKPSNVLYSRDKDMWKIADFGFASVVASSTALTSAYGRGTPGYRAPELMFVEPIKFTKKVDVWGVGCILYELLTHRKAFRDDHRVHEYWQSDAGLSLMETKLPDILESHLLEFIHELLHRDPEKRPRIEDLSLMFHSYCAILDHAITQSINDVRLIPDYSHYRDLVQKCKTQDELLYRLAQYYQTTKAFDSVIPLAAELVCRYPAETSYQRMLAEAYEENGDRYMAIAGWKNIVDKNPDVKIIQDKLVEAISKNSDTNISVHVWKQLVDKHPDHISLEMRLIQAIQESAKIEETVTVLTKMTLEHPNNVVLRNELKIALNTRGNINGAVKVWKELVDQHPDILCLQVQLRWACDAHEDKDKAIEIWKELVGKHPSAASFQDRLRTAFKARGDLEEGAAEWKLLKDKYPIIGDFDRRSRCAIA